MTKQPEKLPKQPQGVSLYFSWDFFHRETRIVDKGSLYWLSKCCLFVQTVDKKGNKQLHSTEVWHNIFNWRQVTLGEGTIQDYLDFGIMKNLHIYTVRSVNQPFLHATRKLESGKVVTDVFKADYTGAHFNRILANVVSESSNQIAFQEVESLEGLYFANIYDESYLKVYSELSNTNGIKHGDMNQFITTLVSFNFGSSWSRVTPPNLNMKGEPFRCKESGCFLNLHLKNSDRVPWLHGVKSAPGIIMAVGSVGAYLTDMDSDMSVFLSDDGGVTWKEVFDDGSYTFEIADQGGILIAAKYMAQTSVFKYSNDRGNTWVTKNLELKGSTEPAFSNSVK